MAQTTEFIDFIAKSEKVFLEKTQNFLTKIDSYTTLLGLDDAELTALKTNLTSYIDACNKKNALHAEARAATQNCNDLLKPLTKEIRSMKKDAELSPNCTMAILEDLGMNNSKKIIDMDTGTPNLKVKLVAGIPQVRYKKTPYDAIRLHCSINKGATSFEETVTQNYYNDTKPRVNSQEPEQREYTAFYIKKGQIVGQKSKKVKIILEAV